jgi:uncharacterized protein YciI
MKNLLIVFTGLISSHLFAQEYDRVFVFLNVNPNKEVLSEDSVKSLMDGHFNNMGALGTAGKLINAGPFEGGGGIFVMNSPNVDSVKLWLQSDPAVNANRWIIEMYPFTTTEGGSCVVGADYEMVGYQFVRYRPNNEIANYKSNPNFEKQLSTDELVSKLKEEGNLIMAGHFASNEGGVLVMANKSGIETITNSTLANSGTISIEYKELWIAKGSFCED